MMTSAPHLSLAPAPHLPSPAYLIRAISAASRTAGHAGVMLGPPRPRCEREKKMKPRTQPWFALISFSCPESGFRLGSR